MNYAIRILLEQKELLTDEMQFAEGEERAVTERRLTDTANALNKLNLPDVSYRRELLNNFSSWLNEQYKLNIPPDEDDVNRYLKNYQ